jgi:transposase InsO family protein
MSPKGNCWDNAVTETLFGSLKVEGLHGERWKCWPVESVEIDKPFPTLLTDLGNRSNRFPHSHRHGDYDEMKLIS